MTAQELPADRVETAILRFRDLVTGPGGTVQQHNAIARASGSVWWGWWHKLGEQVPLVTFDWLVQRIGNARPLRILLLDSGQNKVYVAGCLQIEWGHGRSPMDSPDPALTPAYYKAEKYLAWFKLDGISEIDAGELRQYACLRVDEFFTENPSNYELFYNKAIYAAEELQQQNRTIWFVRRSRADDPHHFVQLLDNNRIIPSDFPSRILVSERDRLLWISDLHFGPHHGFPLMTGDTRRDLWNALAEATNNGPKIAGLLISGDLTWKAERSEYDQFGDFVRNLLSTTRWDSNYFVTLCPGNHDLTFSPDRPAKGADPGRVSEEARAEYERAYQAIFYLKPNRFLCNGRRYLLKQGIPVEVVALNSLLLQQTAEVFQGQGFVGQLQLDFAAEQMGWTQPGESESGAFRILMLHHHLLPVTYREDAKVDKVCSSIVFDANAVIEWIADHRIDLVIHGHQHQPFCAKLSYPLRRGGNPAGAIERWHDFHVVGLGSSGVAIDDLGETKTNTYGMVIFDRSGATVSIRPLSPGRVSEGDELWSVRIPRK